jgi:putative membrane protein insertion efficiency factor
MKKSRKVVLWCCFALGFYLAAEAMVPPANQPSARLGVALLRAYQATGSKAMESAGVHCRYYPSCSHYAVDAISHYGTMSGVARTAGRLFRCSPWGGSGFDPAVEPRSLAYVDPGPQETEEQRRQREQAQKEWEKVKKELGPEAGKAAAACGASCVIMVITGLVGIGILVFMMVFTYKDAKARGDQNAVLWLVLIFFLHWIGFIVYMVARPKGELVPCPNCHQKKMDVLTKCPHCGTETASAAPKPPAPPQA